MPSGHFMKVTFKNSLICVGQVLNEIDITITDKDGNDLTSNYKINKLEGMLEIKPLKVKVVIGSLNLVYTGKVMDKRLASGKVTGLEGLAIAYESDIKYTIKDYVNASQMYTVGKQTQYVPYLDAIYVKNGKTDLSIDAFYLEDNYKTPRWILRDNIVNVLTQYGYKVDKGKNLNFYINIEWGDKPKCPDFNFAKPIIKPNPGPKKCVGE